MLSAVRQRLSYSNAIATLALFIALGGVAVAAGLPRNSVGPRQLKRGAVTTAKLRKQAVTAAKLAPKSVVGGKLAPNSVGPGNIGNGAVTTAKLAKGSVIAETIKNSVVTTNKLNNEAVTTAKLGKESVSMAKLGNGVPGQLQTTATGGVTLRGAFDLGSVAASPGDTTRGAISLQYPVPTPVALGVTVVAPGQAPVPNCPGFGANETPQANPGKLCVYLTKAVNLDGNPPLEAEGLSSYGTGLVAKAAASGAFYGYGMWAYTAP